MRIRAIAAVLILTLAPAFAAAAEEPYRIVDRAKATASTIEGQAMVLARLAWPTDPVEHEVSALARQQLLEFGTDGLAALRWAVVNVPERFQADAVAALLESRDRLPAELPPEYLPALEETVWYSSVEAKRLAIPEITAHKYLPAMITMIDAAYMYTELRLDVARSLGLLGNDRVRHFLHKVMREGSPGEALTAATSLARIGDRALGTLRAATADDVRQARLVAVRALLPISSVDDLSRLHDFVALHGDEDPPLTAKVRSRADLLEMALERQQLAEAATAVD